MTAQGIEAFAVLLRSHLASGESGVEASELMARVAAKRSAGEP